MRAGTLRKLVTLQSRSSTRDAAGEPAYSWTDVVTVGASITPMTGREREIAQAINADVSHQISMRYRPGVTAAMRVSHEGRYFNIVSVIDVDERHRELQLVCSEGLSNG